MIRIDAAALAIVIAAGLSACGREDTGPGDDPPPADRPAATDAPAQGMATPAEAERRPVVTVSEGESPHLVDSAGQALYVLAGNEDGSRCDAACEDAWPPVQAEDAQPEVEPFGLADHVGTMPRGDGGLHVTWNGQPLYRYAADSGVGATAGHGVQDQWGSWSLVSPGGDPIAH